MQSASQEHLQVYLNMLSLQYFILAFLCTASATPTTVARHTLSYRQPSTGTWSTLASIPLYARQEHSTVALNSTHLFILGGIVPQIGNSTLPTVPLMQAYSISTNTWTSVAPLPTPLNHANAAVVNGRIYVLGGLNFSPDGPSWIAAPYCFVYDPISDSWSTLNDMPDERGSAAVAVRGDTILLAGGMTLLSLGNNTQTSVSTVSAYNTITQTWSKLPELPSARDHAGVALINDVYYVLGGRNSGRDNIVGTVFTLDFAAYDLAWTSSSALMPTPRGGCASAVYNGVVYTFGGEGDGSVPTGVFNNTESYDPATDSWTELTPMALPRHGTAAVQIGGKIYIAGGGDQEGGFPTDDLQIFTPGS